MAGKKEKKDGVKGSLLPKSIAGIKLPKEVRRKLSGLAKHPVVADLLAAGLVALAAKLKNEPEAKPAAAKTDDKPAEAIKPVVDAAAAAAAPVVKRVRKPAAATAAKPAGAAKPATTAKPAAKRKPAAKPAAAAKPVPAAKPTTAAKPAAKRKPAAAGAKPRAPRAPKTSA
jgi:hypothetical protein